MSDAEHDDTVEHEHAEIVNDLTTSIIDSIDRVAAALLTDDGAIRVWDWESAPESLRELSAHGGDEDWLAWVPAGKQWPSWAYSGSAFGVADVDSFELPDGSTVLIGAHS